jgi:diguanylate cyclase (GGDEF)-like protein
LIEKFFQKIQPRKLNAIYANIEEFRIATIIFRTIMVLFVAFVTVSAIAFFSGDSTLILIILLSGLFLTIPIIFLLGGQLRLSSISLLVLVITTMAISAILGQGIHDIAILVFPIVVFYANLVLKRSDFYWISAFIMAALSYIGLGETFGWHTTKPFKESAAIDLLIAITILIVAILVSDTLAENIRKNMELAQKEIALREKAQAELRHLNIHDQLTGIYNRSFFDEMALLLEKRNEYPVSIIFADIDDLKAVNDKYGHAAGDDLLQRTAQLIGQAFREGDILARIGGDEFAILLPQTDGQTAQIICGRMADSLEKYNENNPNKQIWISYGFSTCEAGSLNKTVMEADQRMYANKANRKSK